MKQINERELTPYAYVTRGKKRIKQFNNNTVYLEDKQEFEIELFNPTSDKVLATIEFNGKKISSTGIVIKPGQRVFLERFIDNNKKFLFDTYEIDGNDTSAKKAIENNGLIMVSFSKRNSPSFSGLHYPTYPNRGIYYYTSPSWVTVPFVANNPNFNTNTVICSSPTLTNPTLTTSTIATNYFGDATTTSTNTVSSYTTNTIETGRVEAGSTSNQTFSNDYDSYEMFPTWFSKWQILPSSRKVIEASDIAVFCGNCGAKRKKDTHRFCPHCGNKF